MEKKEASRENEKQEEKRRTIDVEIVFREDLRSVIYGISRAIEDSAQHIFRHRKLHAAPCELDMGRFHVHTRGAFEHLHDRLLSLNLENLPTAFGPIRQRELHDFII